MSAQPNQLVVGERSTIASTAVFDTSAGAIVVGDDVTIGHYSVIYANTVLGDGVTVGSHASIGIAESGYAMGRHRDSQPGAAIAPGSVIRDGVHVYGDVTIGTNVAVGHHTLLRTGVQVGDESQLAHYVSVERGTRLGRYVRSSPHSHLTGDLIAEDRVFFGAGVKTINDRSMHWRTGQPIELHPPVFRHGASVGSGSTIGAGVEVGEWAMIGSHSLALEDVPAYAVVVGSPARHLRDRTPPELT